MGKSLDNTETSIDLPANQVHIWHAHLSPSQSQLLHLQALLSDDEIKRARQYKFLQHQEAFIAARGILRLILGRYIGASAESLSFEHGSHGKPFLTSPTTPNYQFNVSHSQNRALYAVSLDREVGIDIECHRRPLDHHAIIQRIGSPAEKMVFSKMAPSELEQCFFACWTRKEAYVKAIGKGMTIPLSSITVSLPPSEYVTLIHIPEAEQDNLSWSMNDIFIGSDYSAALVVEGFQSYSISHFHWTWDTFAPRNRE